MAASFDFHVCVCQTSDLFVYVHMCMSVIAPMTAGVCWTDALCLHVTLQWCTVCLTDEMSIE